MKATSSSLETILDTDFCTMNLESDQRLLSFSNKLERSKLGEIEIVSKEFKQVGFIGDELCSVSLNTLHSKLRHHASIKSVHLVGFGMVEVDMDSRISMLLLSSMTMVGIIDPKKPSGSAKPIQYLYAAKLPCNTKVKHIKSVFSNIDERNIPFICIDLVYEYTLLVDEFGLHPKQEITVVHEIICKYYIVGVAWPLGCAIDVVSSSS